MNDIEKQFESHIPLIAILRGVKPDEVISIAEALVQEGIRIIEVPLNSPEAFKSIEMLHKSFGQEAVIGAGTVLNCEDVEQAHKVGAKIIVAPNMNEQVMKKTRDLGMLSIPGVFTPTEAFAAINNGAYALKFFPAVMFTPETIKAIRAVMPKEAKIFAVGGCDSGNMHLWAKSGCNGFGLGTAIYKPNDDANNVRQKAKELVEAFNEKCRDK